jgi:hypothetical protein
MMDEATIRHQLADYRNRLEHMDDERKALQQIVEGLESLLRATGSAPSGTKAANKPATAKVAVKASNVPVGSISMRSAVMEYMRNAKSEPRHSRDVLAGVSALGAHTNAKEPISVIDLVLLGLVKKGRVEKVAPRTWRWIGGDA